MKYYLYSFFLFLNRILNNFISPVVCLKRNFVLCLGVSNKNIIVYYGYLDDIITFIKKMYTILVFISDVSLIIFKM